MPLFKKKITEKEAAAQFVIMVMEKTKEIWPTVYASLKDTYKDSFIIEDETMIIFDFSLAVLALETQALRNLFPKEQAERIYKWVLHCIDSPEYGEYAIEDLKKYERDFQEALEASENPLGAISTRLLHRWLRKNI